MRNTGLRSLRCVKRGERLGWTGGELQVGRLERRSGIIKAGLEVAKRGGAAAAALASIDSEKIIPNSVQVDTVTAATN